MEKELTQNNGVYSTTNTPLAIYLISQKYNLSEIDYSQSRYSFIFDGNYDELFSVELAYLSGTAKVEPTSYERIRKRLMRVIHRQGQWNEDF